MTFVGCSRADWEHATASVTELIRSMPAAGTGSALPAPGLLNDPLEFEAAEELTDQVPLRAAGLNDSRGVAVFL